MSGEAGVKVFCRFRPFNKREIELGADKAVDFQVSAATSMRLDLTEGCIGLTKRAKESYRWPHR